MKVLVATRNRHKLAEIRAILQVPGLVLTGLWEVPPLPEVVEDGLTFEANAMKKARETALMTGQWTLADDSGLEVLPLGGEPGVRSARFAGEPSNDAANNALLLRKLQGLADRAARFRCAIALCDPSGRCETVSGTCSGHIVEGPRGQGGFGYDPLFVPDGFDRTYAELAEAEKHRISHRGRALEAAVTRWRKVLEGDTRAWPQA